MRRGPKVGNVSQAARLIFDRIGESFPIKNQDDLRRVASVGSQQIRKLRLSPEKVEPEILVRFADAVEANVVEVFRAAGHQYAPEEIKTVCENARRVQNYLMSGLTVIELNHSFSAEDLQVLTELGKLLKGPVPLKYGLQLLAIRRDNSKKSKPP